MVIDNWRFSDTVPETILFAGEVIHGQSQTLIGLLLDIGLEFLGVETLIVTDLDFILDQTILAVFQYTGRTAGDGENGQGGGNQQETIGFGHNSHKFSYFCR